jgi:hypothetical protein
MTTSLQDFLQAQLPACRFAAARTVPTKDPNLNPVQVTCSAPADLAAACGYPVGRCPHHGPFRSVEEREEDTRDCLIRQSLRLR